MQGRAHVGIRDLTRRVGARPAPGDLVDGDVDVDVEADRAAELAEFDNVGEPT